MTVPLVVGAGAVGLHAARQLVTTPGVERVLVTDSDPRRPAAVADAIGEGVEAVEWKPGGTFPRSPSVVVSAVPAAADTLIVEYAVEAGLPSVSCADGLDAVRRVLDLDAAAGAAGVAVIVGAGLAPGLSELLAVHAAEALDRVDEVQVSRFGITGPACRRAARRAAWGHATELDGGAWTTPRAGSGRRLVYFPEPGGPHDCRRAANGSPLLVARALPDVGRATIRHAMGLASRLAVSRPLAPRRSAETLGGVHVEVRGARGSGSEVLTYGVVDRMAAATGAVLAAAAALVTGLVVGLTAPSPGVRGIAETGPPGALLSELARRGVRAARFEG